MKGSAAWKAVPLFFLFGSFAFLLFSTARRTSLVYDEVIYPTAGYLYWTTGDLRWNSEHPPLQKWVSSLPLVWEKKGPAPSLNPLKEDAWRAGFQIFFDGTDAVQQRILSCRLPTAGVALLLGIAVFLVTKKRHGFDAGLVALGALVFDPLVLGNGALAMNDLFVTFFIFLSVVLFERWLDSLEQPSESKTGLASMAWAVATGLATGAAVASKFSGFLLLPIFCVLFVARAWKRPLKAWGMRGAGAVLLIVCALFVVLASYKFDFSLIAHALARGLTFHKPNHRPGYLLGSISDSSAWFYYPVAVLIKTPLGLLGLWGLSFWIFFRDRLFSKRTFFLIVPIVLTGAAALSSHNHFGVRYLLPAIPFLSALVGQAYGALKPGRERAVAWLLVGWMAAEAFFFHPHHMAYFNALIGGPRQGARWLDGSNQDWGQDLPALADFLKQQANNKEAPSNNVSVLLGYFGSNQPEAWGIQYQDVASAAIANSFRADLPNPVQVDKEFLVVSAHLMNNPVTRPIYQWLEEKRPAACLGYTLFVYDVTHDVPAVLRLADLYLEMGRLPLARRQLERAILLDPENTVIRAALQTVSRQITLSQTSTRRSR